MNFGLIRIVNIYGKPTYPGLEIDQEYYVIMIRDVNKSQFFSRARQLNFSKSSIEK